MSKPPEKWTLAKIDERGKLAHQKWLQKYYPEVAAKSAQPKSTPAPAPSSTEVNAFEAALAKSETGRRLLTLLEETARLRIHEQLAAELVRCSQEEVASLKRVPCGGDLIARERAAAQLYSAEPQLAKWQRAHADYQHRREMLEYAMRDLARALPLGGCSRRSAGCWAAGSS
jgi:hypothetical protein